MENVITRALKNAFTTRSSQDPGSIDITDWPSGIFGNISRGGVAVNHKTALSLSAVYNAVDQISNDIAKLPKGVYQKKDGDRFRLSAHPVDYIIGNRPNALMTQFSFHKAMMLSVLLRGNGIAVIESNRGTGFPSALIFIHPDHVNDIKKKDGHLFYYIKGYDRPLNSEEVIHIPGFSENGITGISVFKYAAQNLGAAMSAEKFADENFKSRGLLAGIIKSDKQLKPEAKTALGNAMETRLGKGDVNNIGVLDEGMDFLSITANAQEASLIDWKNTSMEDVARWFNIAPHKIKHLARSTNNNIEQQSLEHGSDTIAPWSKKFEEEYTYKLFPRDQRNTYVKLNTNALYRTDLKTKGEYYSKAVNGGWLTRNEARALEDYNRLKGLDEPLTPVNTKTQEQLEKELANEV